MTLATVPRYDGDRIASRKGHAVVIGASMAGLFTTRVLADAFDEVTVIERDQLTAEIETRPGVPQGKHVHVLLEGGRATIEDLFPGFCDELLDAGGVIANGEEFQVFVQGDTLVTTDRQSLHLSTRALYEHLVRRHVDSFDNVSLRSPCRFVDYVANEDATAVEGVVIRNKHSEREILAADLVVDAIGRTSRTPAWLKKRGYDPPPLEEVTIDIGYASTFIERPADDHLGISMEAEAPRTRGAFVFPVEGDRWLLNLHGVHGDYPLTDPEGFREFSTSLPTTTVTDLLDEHPMTDENIAFYPFRSNRRYRYEALERFPEGLIVIGDAIASFNPVNGQGMSVAALEALALHHVLARGGRDGMAHRFFEAASDVVDIAWDLTIGADLEFPQTEGSLPRRTAIFDWYLNRLTRRAHTDVWLSNRMWTVFMLEQPPSVLFRPRVIWRELGPARRRRREKSSQGEPPRDRPP
ncbi:FAD-dependent oxidoreductase [Halostagnicola bangensis]